MSELLRLGLTGGAACGKSTVAECFRERGVPVIDADTLVRELTAPEQPLLAALLDRVGASFQNEDGSLNRAQLRMQLFQDETLRRNVEDLLHPPVREEIRRWFAEQQAPLAVAVVPLLLEAGWHNEVDRIVVVNCPASVQRERLQHREGIGAALAEAILSCQLSEAERVRQANDVLENNSTRDDLIRQIAILHESYIQL